MRKLKENLKVVLISASVFVLGAMFTHQASYSIPTSYKVAVVDIQTIISESSQITAIKNEQQAKLKALTAFAEKANKEIQAEKDPNKQKVLESKYQKELATKKNIIQKDYQKKLDVVNKNLLVSINNHAKASGYDLVLSKGVVFFGGTDITNHILKSLK